MDLKSKLLIELRTPLGYMQVLEYVLQDYSYLHVINWHFNNILEENLLVPSCNSLTFYKDKEGALLEADKIGRDLLLCYNS